MHLARFGTFLLPVSLFWFAWTSYPSVHWIVPIVASAFFGAGIYIIILAILNYVVDSYQTYSASALAGVILVRNLVGAGFPLFGKQMYQTLGWEWAGTLLAFLSIPLCAIPFVFFYKGEAIRLKSPWARYGGRFSISFVRFANVSVGNTLGRTRISRINHVKTRVYCIRLEYLERLVQYVGHNLPNSREPILARSIN